uniref:Uncharacterized protein n=1 Tax=viral metagenome TaxID=1070528 RepID=A0A6C0LS48_9ZZZZ
MSLINHLNLYLKYDYLDKLDYIIHQILFESKGTKNNYYIFN